MIPDETPKPHSSSISTGDISAQNVNIAGRDVNIYNLPRLGKPPLQLPPRAEHFIGRESELDQLLHDLQPGKVITLYGPGGIGKTALAAEALWILTDGVSPPKPFPDGVIFHTFYPQPQSALALEHIALSYGEDPRPTPQDAALRVLAGKSALIILDGAEACDNLPAVLEVRGLCGVLVTTRKPSDATQDRFNLSPLPLFEALSLLNAWAHYQVKNQVPLEKICALVGCLPLALRLVGRYLESTGEDIIDYLSWMESTPLNALDFGKRQSESVVVLLDRSIAQVSETACQVLGVVGVLALSSFRREVVGVALRLGRGELAKALWELVSYGLLARRDIRYEATHALLHTYVRERYMPGKDVVIRLAAFFDTFAREKCVMGMDGYEQLDFDREHILAIQALCLKIGEWYFACQLTWALNDYMDLRGYWASRVTLLQNGLEAALKSEDRVDEGAFTGLLGLTWFNLGETQKAITYHEQALSIHNQICDRRGVANDLGNLGLAWADLGEPRKAIFHHEQALSIDHDIGDSHGEGIHLSNLGLVWADMGETYKAIECHEQALTLAQETGDKRAEGNRLGNLGNAWYLLGSSLKAIKYYEKGLEIAIEIGDRHGEENHKGSLGNAWRMMGEAPKAIEYHEQALAIARQIGDRRGESQRLGSLGNAWSDLGETHKAIDYYEQALRISRQVGDRRGEGYRLANLGSAYEELGDLILARSLWKQTLEIFQIIEDPNAKMVKEWLDGLERIFRG